MYDLLAFYVLAGKKVSVFVPRPLFLLSHKGETGLYIFGIRKN